MNSSEIQKSEDGQFIITAAVREKTGKGYARKLRRLDKIPGVILDKGKSTLVELDPKLLGKVWQSGKGFVLQLDGKQRKALLQDVQVDAIKRNPLHVDIVYQ